MVFELLPLISAGFDLHGSVTAHLANRNYKYTAYRDQSLMNAL